MNREIKYRAWWIEKKIMLHNVHDFYDSMEAREHGNKYEPVSSFGMLLDEPEKYIPIQYTGLKDKNDVEIYEGYIVEWMGLKFPITVDDTHGYRFMFGLDQLNKATAIDGEVIGNIYENPELIK